VQPVSHCTLCPFLFLAYSVVLISNFLALSLSVVLSRSFCLSEAPFLKVGVSSAPWWLSLSFFFTLLFSFSLSLSHSLTGPVTLLFSPPHSYLFLSLPHDCDGSQRPAQMRVISDSILTDSELGLEFVVTLWYNMRFLQGSSCFSLALFQSESRCWLCAYISLFLSLSLQLLVVLYWYCGYMYECDPELVMEYPGS